MVRLKTDPELCGDCKLCLVDCQGGANPNGKAPWKPSECMFCMNCQSSCASHAITFKIEVPGSAIGKSKLHSIEQEEVGHHGK